MTHIVSDGLTLIQVTGRKARDGMATAATGVRNELGTVANGIHEEFGHLRHSGESAAHKQGHKWPAHVVEPVASVAGALAAFVVSRLIRSRMGRRES